MKQIIIGVIFFLTGLLSNAQPSSLQSLFYFARYNMPEVGPYLEFYISVFGKTVRFVPVDSLKDKQQATIEMVLQFKQDSTICFARKFDIHSPLKNTNDPPVNFVTVKRIPLPKGFYSFELSLHDKNDTVKPYTYRTTIDLNYPENKPYFSDIEYIASFQSATDKHPEAMIKNNYFIEPYVADFYPETINHLTFYAELYNTAPITDSNDVFLLRYFFVNQETNNILPNYVFTTRQHPGPVVPIFSSIDISNLPSGEYNLVLQAIDKHNKTIAKKTFAFIRSHPSLDEQKITTLLDTTDITKTFVASIPDDSLPIYIRYLRPISSQVEFSYARNQLKSANPHYMRVYFLSFWLKRNAKDPQKEWENYHKQVELVNRTYDTPIRRGFETDRGRIYLKYGRPDDIIFRYNEPSSYPYEIWQYYQTHDQRNVKFIFYDPSLMQSDFVLLSSTARGEPHISNWQYYLHRRNTPIVDPYNNRIDDYYGGKLNDDLKD